MRKIILVFGEDPNDTAAVAHLIRGLRPDRPDIGVQPLRRPVIHLKDMNPGARRRGLVEEIAALSDAQGVTANVVAVVVHQDCDACEPAHEGLAATITKELSAVGVPHPVAAVPAWEMEAWWMLFPEALSQVRACWNQINFKGRSVGYITNAKEALRRALRPPNSRGRCPDYEASDSVTIARRIRELGIASAPREALSGSYSEFLKAITDLPV